MIYTIILENYGIFFDGLYDLIRTDLSKASLIAISKV